MLAATVGDTGNSLDGWLRVHEISAEDVTQFLKILNCPSAVGTEYTTTIVDVSPEEAWSLVTEAMAWKFPSRTDFIYMVADRIEVEFVKDIDEITRPFILHRGPDEFPFVSMYYTGDIADVLAVAHELGHAIQLVATQGSFISPIKREIAAFLSELILLDFTRVKKHPLFDDLRLAHRRDDAVYLGSDVKLLKLALRDCSAAYAYRWNYPLARLLALRDFRTLLPGQLWNTLSGEVDLSEKIKRSPEDLVMNKLENYLPTVPEPEREFPALNTYRSLGMMALLDIDYWQGQSETSIDEYYSSLLDHINNNSAFIAFSRDKKPIGYATWQKDLDDPDAVCLTRQTAPFGDHLILQRKLQARFPNVKQVKSLHTRSSREVQVAW